MGLANVLQRHFDQWPQFVAFDGEASFERICGSGLTQVAEATDGVASQHGFAVIQNCDQQGRLLFD